jgi:diguanylate cyclase (GGDEF)-like protein
VAGESQSRNGPRSGSAGGRIVLEVAEVHATLLAKLRDELGADTEAFARAAQRLAREFGSIAATALDAAEDGRLATAVEAAEDTKPALKAEDLLSDAPLVTDNTAMREQPQTGEPQELPSLYRPGHMRRRLEQLVETNRRYGHPFGLAVFDVSGPGVRSGSSDGNQETVLSILGAALRDSIRIVDEAFRLEEDAICILAPNLRTVEGMQMAERLLIKLDELERVGGLRIAIAAGVVACPEHGTDAEELLRRADAAMWRARAVGQPVGVGALQDR